MGPFTRVRASEDDAVRSASAKQSSERASRAAAAATVLGVAVVLALACVSVAAAAPVFSEVSSGREEGVGIVTGLDGAMWLTDGTFRGDPTTGLLRVPVHGGRIRAYRGPAFSLGVPSDPIVAPDGNLWFSDLVETATGQAGVLVRAGLRTCLRRVYWVVQGCRPGVGASRRVITPTIAHLTIATEVLVSRS